MRSIFKYGLVDILGYYMCCAYCRKKKNLIKNPRLRKHVLLEKGKDKLDSEMDAVTLVRSIR